MLFYYGHSQCPEIAFSIFAFGMCLKRAWDVSRIVRMRFGDNNKLCQCIVYLFLEGIFQNIENRLIVS
jgi:hypothetical protein